VSNDDKWAFKDHDHKEVEELNAYTEEWRKVLYAKPTRRRKQRRLSDEIRDVLTHGHGDRN
jgi:hypothetical protein